jgi:hypothetical protein
MARLLVGLMVAGLGCRSGKVEQADTAQDTGADTAEWWEGDVDESEDTGKESDTGKNADTGKPDDGGDPKDCGEDFDSEASCEGSWDVTICVHEGLIWWCEDGVWMNEDDKPE